MNDIDISKIIGLIDNHHIMSLVPNKMSDNGLTKSACSRKS